MYGLTAVALAVVSVLLVGVDGSVAWVRILLEPESGQVLANAWRMVSLKSFLDVLLPGLPALALVLYVACGAAILAGVWRLWSALRPAVAAAVILPAEPVILSEPATEGSASQWRRRFDLAWIYTSLAAVLVDPHLVDYDLSVLVAAGIVGAALVPRLAPAIVLLYLVALLRAQVPLGDASVLLTPVVLAGCTVRVYRQIHTPRIVEVGEPSVELVGART